jgi:hypothetical protein
MLHTKFWFIQTWLPQAILVSDWPIFSSPCLRQCELLPSLGVRRLLTFHILIFSSETAKPIDIWSCSFRGEDFFKSANQKQELAVVAMFNGSGRNERSL